MPWLPYFLICVLVIWWQPNTWTNVCVLVDYIQHFRSKGWKHEENKLKKPMKTQRLKPSKEKQNIPIHRLNRWRQKIYVGAVVRRLETGNTLTGWTDDEDIEYVGAMAEEDQGKCIHRLNRWCTGQLRRCSCPESWFFSWSEDNYIHRSNRHYIG